jgi:hypothetical protein
MVLRPLIADGLDTLPTTVLHAYLVPSLLRKRGDAFRPRTGVLQAPNATRNRSTVMTG